MHDLVQGHEHSFVVTAARLLPTREPKPTWQPS
ncbi:Uncharacterised protein [Mycolicibacterium gilvum]|uniref:Uncharacterized protein n=1 Tax=Mycolicibacterium gilvum TaxID=1804 RepID=A0A378SLN9_9MYCO|nr:Uncharacterised protein [Mycolicibacterium gilvum]